MLFAGSLIVIRAKVWDALVYCPPPSDSGLSIAGSTITEGIHTQELITKIVDDELRYNS
jgi:hypothetical protein